MAKPLVIILTVKYFAKVAGMHLGQMQGDFKDLFSKTTKNTDETFPRWKSIKRNSRYFSKSVEAEAASNPQTVARY